MSTLDEITKEKQRVSEALVRVDAQREKLVSQLGELEATERVLARSAKASRPEGRLRPRRPPRQRRPLPRSRVVNRAARPQNQPLAGRPRRASAIRSLPWQTARRSKKSPMHAKGFAPTMSASPSPGTSGPAASKSAMGSSMRRNRRSKPNPLRSNTGTNSSVGVAPKLGRALIRL
jgi:hypothetical protein